MRTADFGSTALAYELVGDGEPLLLIHGSNLADGLLPLASALAEEAPWLGLLRYHRRGYGGSRHGDAATSVDQHAVDAWDLLDHLGIASAHVVGYSYGGVVALQAALTAPSRVQSLTLLEPILLGVPCAADFLAAMAPVIDRYAKGDMQGALTATLQGLGGSDWEDLVASTGPDAFAMAIRDTSTYYRYEGPSLERWTLDPNRASAITCPLLSVLGDASDKFFVQGRALLHQHFPQCTDADIPNANHLLNLQAPQPIAKAIAEFLPRGLESAHHHR